MDIASMRAAVRRERRKVGDGSEAWDCLLQVERQLGEYADAADVSVGNPLGRSYSMAEVAEEVEAARAETGIGQGAEHLAAAYDGIRRYRAAAERT